MSCVYVIGIGFKPLDVHAADAMRRSSAIFASGRLMEVFPFYAVYPEVKDKVIVLNSVDATIEAIRERLDKSSQAEIVLLASGDPMFYGIGSRAVEEFGSERVKIMSDMSSMQNAFARISEAWHNALLVSLHGGPYPGRKRKLRYAISDIPVLLEKHRKIGILTDKQSSPQAIARHIIKSMPEKKYQQLQVYVFEKLGYPEEKITKADAHQISKMEFSDPNIVLLIRPEQPNASCFADDIKFGLSENEIEHARGLITKDEARAVSLHKLKLPNSGVMYDIGAGSGSVSIEAAGISPGLSIYAIEKNPEHAEICRRNRTAFNSLSIEVVEGEAPDCLESLPMPQRVFIGGSGNRISSIIDHICAKSSPIFVINAITLETLNEAVAALEKNEYSSEVVSLSVSRTKDVAGKKMMESLNQIFIIKGEKH